MTRLAREEYDRAQTPAQRLLASGRLSEAQRQALEREGLAVNPATLTRHIAQTRDALWKLRESHDARKQVQLG